MGFVHQASRYRGKANYREALFLQYGKSTATILDGFVADQVIVLRAFLAMAGAFDPGNSAKRSGTILLPMLMPTALSQSRQQVYGAKHFSSEDVVRVSNVA